MAFAQALAFPLLVLPEPLDVAPPVFPDPEVDVPLPDPPSPPESWFPEPPQALNAMAVTTMRLAEESKEYERIEIILAEYHCSAVGVHRESTIVSPQTWPD